MACFRDLPAPAGRAAPSQRRAVPALAVALPPVAMSLRCRCSARDRRSAGGGAGLCTIPGSPADVPDREKQPPIFEGGPQDRQLRREAIVVDRGTAQLVEGDVGDAMFEQPLVEDLQAHPHRFQVEVGHLQHGCGALVDKTCQPSGLALAYEIGWQHHERRQTAGIVECPAQASVTIGKWQP